MRFSTRLTGIVLALLATGHGFGRGQDLEGRHGPIRPARPGQVAIEDSFWAPRLEVYRTRTIPHSWTYVEAEIRALRKAAGEPVEGEPNGTWGEANLYKVLETVAHSLAMHPDPELEAKADAIIGQVARAQRADGYVHAYITNSGKTPWDPLFLDGSHDGYVLGHLIEAAIAYDEATGQGAFLEVARRAADQAYEHFLGPAGRPGFDGHAELELALVALSERVHDPRYLELARAFVEWRGRRLVRPFSETPRAYFQDHLPVREQTTLEGHAVRAVFFATGVAELALATGEADYRLAADRYWQSTAGRRMTITGSIGPRQEHEAIGEDYELPTDGYYESCAACGLVQLAHRMFRLERRGESIDVLERALYNAVLHGISLDGTSTYYTNPLSDRERPRHNAWVCCPPNLSRTLLQVGRFAYAADDRDVWVNLYVGGSCRWERPAGPLVVRQTTDYPWDGRVRIEVEPPSAEPLALNVRIPGWCRAATLTLNGEAVALEPIVRDGFARIDRVWKSGDRVDLELDLSIETIEGHPRIGACAGRVAVQRGPIVYGFEGLDNGGDTSIELGGEAVPWRAEPFRPDWLGGIVPIGGHRADGRPIVAVPFAVLANREPSSQDVWVAGDAGNRSESWWLGRLYRPVMEVEGR